MTHSLSKNDDKESSLPSHLISETAEGIRIQVPDTESGGVHFLQLHVLSDDIIRVLGFPSPEATPPTSLCVETNAWKTPDFKVSSSEDGVQLTTTTLCVDVLLPTGNVIFRDASGNVLLEEDGRQLQAQVCDNDSGYSIKQKFKIQDDEAIYGFGQYQDGILNWRGHAVELSQENLIIANPTFVSTKGYGILWDNYSFTKFVDKYGKTFIWSELGDALDYYFIQGPSLDEVIAGYRNLTGSAPMFPKWAYGYTQSKANYNSQAAVLDTVREFRKRNIPLDVIVKDWNYWPDKLWGQKSFDPKLFPDVDAMTRELHDLHIRILVSVWPNMHDDSENCKEFKDNDMLLYHETQYTTASAYDAFNEEARKLYWRQVEEGILSHGVDGLWCDASEPDTGGFLRDINTNKQRLNSILGSGTRYLNPYSLMHAKGIYENWRSSGRPSRVVNLTRSAFAGQQKYGTISWSGDITGTWETFKNQIPGGLNFCLSGIPYWNTDIGGWFVRPWKPGNDWFAGGEYENGPQDEGYKELYVRWFQYGTFCPQFRSHGSQFGREPWQFGEEGSWAYDAILKMIKLRYRLMPYIYSLAYKITFDHYTMMRALAMDFQDDVCTYDIDDQFMFGPSILANPVVTPGATYRKVYLPEGGGGWFDFWNGWYLSSGQTVKAPTPKDTVPLFIKAGSILPLGPDIQYATEKTDPLEIRIYEGADGSFDLYEDENDTYNYEKGDYSLIRFSYSDTDKTLTIADRDGCFPGMLQKRTFNICLIRKPLPGTWEFDESTDIDLSQEPDKTVSYSGTKISVQLNEGTGLKTSFLAVQ